MVSHSKQVGDTQSLSSPETKQNNISPTFLGGFNRHSEQVVFMSRKFWSVLSEPKVKLSPLLNFQISDSVRDSVEY